MTYATEQDLLDYCESVEADEALAHSLTLEYLELQSREFPQPEGDDYDYI